MSQKFSWSGLCIVMCMSMCGCNGKFSVSVAVLLLGAFSLARKIADQDVFWWASWRGVAAFHDDERFGLRGLVVGGFFWGIGSSAEAVGDDSLRRDVHQTRLLA
ncbi:MAG: hypothetical protein Q4D91_06930 [Lautropia sp.]|nr:hypothetical protein [Lautropia sp.]